MVWTHLFNIYVRHVLGVFFALFKIRFYQREKKNVRQGNRLDYNLVHVCFHAQMSVWPVVLCVLFNETERKNDFCCYYFFLFFLSLHLRDGMISIWSERQKSSCLTSNTNDDCNLNEFYTEEITAALRSKLQRRKKRRRKQKKNKKNNEFCSPGFSRNERLL